MLLYVRISPPISKYNASSVFEYKVGPIIDQTATYALMKAFYQIEKGRIYKSDICRYWGICKESKYSIRQKDFVYPWMA